MANAPESNNSSGNGEEASIRRIKEIVWEGEGPVKDAKIPVRIFRIPISLPAMNRLAYRPQLMGLGPFHHCDPKFVGMERYKLAAISRASNLFRHPVEFKQLVKQLMDRQIDQQVRSSYYDYLDGMGNENLVLIMAIDGMFLLEFIRNYVSIKSSNPDATLTAHLVDYSGNKLAHHSIITDIMMLENQIPLFFLKAILSIQLSSDDDDDEQKWATYLISFCKIVAPLKLPNKPGSQKILVFHDSHHLLDLLYNLAVPSSNTAPKNKKNPIPGRKTQLDEEDHMALVDEILIPSVSELIHAGVEFQPADDISSIRFDKETRTFYLPILKLDVNSEVIIRNMVAYEAAIVLDSLDFTRFIELLIWLIGTAQDASRLREKGIVLNSLKSDKDVAELFDGLSKPFRLSHSKCIDNAIKEVNQYYDNTTRVRVYKFLRKHVYESWRFLSLVASLFLFFLTAVQTLCSVYECSRAEKFKT